MSSLGAGWRAELGFGQSVILGRRRRVVNSAAVQGTQTTKCETRTSRAVGPRVRGIGRLVGSSHRSNGRQRREAGALRAPPPLSIVGRRPADQSKKIPLTTALVLRVEVA